MKKINLTESFEKYDHSINKAIVKLTGLDDAEAKKIHLKMDFNEYFDFIMAIERGDVEEAKQIISKYHTIEETCVESIAQEIHYLTRENAECVLTPMFMKLSESELDYVLEEMNHCQIQKILANLKGFSEPGFNEMKATHIDIVNEIKSIISSGINKLNEINMAPGEANRAHAYGTKDTDAEEAEQERQEMNKVQDDEIEANEKEIEELKRRAGIQ